MGGLLPGDAQRDPRQFAGSGSSTSMPSAAGPNPVERVGGPLSAAAQMQIQQSGGQQMDTVFGSPMLPTASQLLHDFNPASRCVHNILSNDCFQLKTLNFRAGDMFRSPNPPPGGRIVAGGGPGGLGRPGMPGGQPDGEFSSCLPLLPPPERPVINKVKSSLGIKKFLSALRLRNISISMIIKD